MSNVQDRDPMLTIDIVGAIRGGDHGAFDDLFKRVGGKVYVYCHARMGARLRKLMDAEDVLQEVYAQAYQSFDEFVDRGSGSMVSWLIGLAANQIRRLYKHHYAYEKRDGDREVALEGGGPGHDSVGMPAIPASGDTPSRIIARDESVQAIVRGMDALDEEQRELILSHVYEDRSIRQIAAESGVAHTTLTYRLTKALRALRERVEPHES